MQRLDEELWAERLDAGERRRRGVYFTPGWLVDEVLAACPIQPRQVIDPAAGAGAFLFAAAAKWPSASLHGLELDPETAEACRERIPRADVKVGDGLADGWDLLTRGLGDGPELWIGNPPYNGTSAVLKDPSRFAALQKLIRRPLPRGTSLRDDFAFFLLRAAHRLTGRDGVLAFVTPTTVIDAFLYGPVRAELLERLELVTVRELPAGTFRGTQVKTCFTVWRGKRLFVSPIHRSADGVASSFEIRAPELRLRPNSDQAGELDQRWRATGRPLEHWVPISFPGLKTRFDELLVDANRGVLEARMKAFFETADLDAFATEHGIPDRAAPKLIALRSSGARFEPERIRPFHHWRGPDQPLTSGFCYLDRLLIPRGDHRLRGGYDPHACAEKLVFNARELPLLAQVISLPGAIPAWRHTRFAPLFVPRRLLTEGLACAASLNSADLADRVPNLSTAALTWAHANGGPRAAFEQFARFINSAPVQQHWAPAFGAASPLPIPLEELGAVPQT